jgi:hypothetical protein
MLLLTLEQEEHRSSGVQEFRSSGVQEFRRILESVAAPSELLWTNST